MVAETAAAFFDFSSTRAFLGEVRRGNYPRPSALRGTKRQPIWYLEHLLAFASRRHGGAPTLSLVDDAGDLI